MGVIFYSCFSGEKNKEDYQIVLQMNADSVLSKKIQEDIEAIQSGTDTSIHLKKEKISELKKKVEAAKVSMSPFENVGCCKEFLQFNEQVENCCCDSVMVIFKKIATIDKIKMVNTIMDTDPFFTKCKKVKNFRIEADLWVDKLFQ